MKVLHMLQSNRFSGAENVVCQIISMCKNEDVEFAYSSRDGQIREALAERNIEFHPVSKVSVAEYRRVIHEVKPDVIHAHDMRACFFAALACGRTPLIAHVHNNNFDSRGLSLKSILFYLAAKKAKHIFWVSQSSLDGYAFHKSFMKKSTVLYNIIDIDALKTKMAADSKTYDYDVVYLGRLTHPKNPQRLIEVLGKAVQKEPDIKIAVIGTGDLEGETKQLVHNKNLTEQIRFLGFQSNPLKILHDAKVMLMTSRWEGTPMCALEAMSLGVPIVSTPTDGLADLIKDDYNGFLSNDDEALAAAVCRICRDAQLHDKLSNNAAEYAAEFMKKDAYIEKIVTSYGL